MWARGFDIGILDSFTVLIEISSCPSLFLFLNLYTCTVFQLCHLVLLGPGTCCHSAVDLDRCDMKLSVVFHFRRYCDKYYQRIY